MTRPVQRTRVMDDSPSALVVVVLDDGARLSFEIGCRGLGWFSRGMQSIGRRVAAHIDHIAWLVLIDSEPNIYNAREARGILGFDR